MAPDDAADVAGELDEEHRERVLALLPVSHRVKVRALLGYDPAEAGGLMSPEFVSLRRTTSAEEALNAVRLSKISPELLTAVFVTSPEGELDGSVPLATLLRSEPDKRLGALVKHELMLGVVTVDDVLEAMLPRGWRRRFGLLGED
jgi:Mg/Co/Ni transporter MgtE